MKPLPDATPPANGVVTAAAVAAGAVHGCAFGSVHGAWLQFCGVALLGVLIFRLRRKGRWALSFGIIGGFWIASNAVGLRWIWAAITARSELGPALGSIAYGLLSVGLCAMTVIALWSAVRLSTRLRSDFLCCALFSSAIVMGDLLREAFLPSFPWLCVGYAHLDSPFAALLPFLGVDGLDWVLLFVSLLVGSAGAAEGLRSATRGSRVGALACTCLVIAALAAAAHSAPTLTHEGPMLRIALMQTAIRGRDKFRASLFGRQLAQIGQFAASHDAQLIITPETAVPTTLRALTPAQVQYLSGLVTASKALLFGAFAEDSRGDIFNSAVLLQSSPEPLRQVKRTIYIKQHLAPFGEYAPPGFKWVAELLAVPMSNLRSTADPPQNFRVAGVTVIPSVCQDLLYGDDLRTTTTDPRLLANLSNVEFFDDPLARRQFLNVARARALEQQLPVVIAANFGPTAMLDAQGLVRQELPAAVPGALEVMVATRQGVTPYARHGRTFLYLLLALGVLSAASPVRRA